jgi:hypothetical protein
MPLKRITAREAMPQLRILFSSVAHAALVIMRERRKSAEGGPSSFANASRTLRTLAMGGHLEYFENRRRNLRDSNTGNEKAFEKPMRSVVNAIE